MLSEALNLGKDPFRVPLVLVFAFSDTSFRILQKSLGSRDDLELRWQSETIEALADIFMQKPDLLIIFQEKNEESLAFLQLLRNRADCRNLPVFVIFPQPQRFWQRWGNRYHILERFSTPIDQSRLLQRTREVIGVL